MNKTGNQLRIYRLIQSAIKDFRLNLKGMTVLTEAASGAFVVSPIIAALAGADKVFAIGRDSKYGKFNDVRRYLESYAYEFGISDRINISSEQARHFAAQANIVTNLGFVRPIDGDFVERLGSAAAIALMWEPWEYRPEDIDLEACKRKGIPVLGTCETHPRLQIFRYVGILALKLLLEAEIEIFKSQILVVGSGIFGDETVNVLTANGVTVRRYSLHEALDETLEQFVRCADAIIVVEHISNSLVIGESGGIPIDWLTKSGIRVIHICGSLNYDLLDKYSVNKLPVGRVASGFMSLTTDYVGPRPVIDLHTAGLKVGEALVVGLRQFGSPERAVSYALNQSPALDFA